MRLEHNNGTFYFSSVFAKSKCNFELICNLSKFVANKTKWNCFFWFFYQCNAANIQDGLVHIWSEKHKYEIGEKFIFWTYLKEPLWAPISSFDISLLQIKRPSLLFNQFIVWHLYFWGVFLTLSTKKVKVSAGTGNFRLVPKFSLQSITDSGLRGSGLGSWTLESLCV